MGEMFVALRRIKVGDGFREPGDPVPEAVSWPTLRENIEGGYIGITSNEPFLLGHPVPEMNGYSTDPANVRFDPQQYRELCEKAGVDPEIGVKGSTRPSFMPKRPESFFDSQAAARARERLTAARQAKAKVPSRLPFDPTQKSVQFLVEYARQNPHHIEDILKAEAKRDRQRGSLLAQLRDLRTELANKERESEDNND